MLLLHTVLAQNVRREPHGRGRITADGPAGIQAEARLSMGALLRLGLFIAAHGVYMIVLPTADPGHWRYYTSDADVIAYLADDPGPPVEWR